MEDNVPGRHDDKGKQTCSSHPIQPKCLFAMHLREQGAAGGERLGG